jgi:hypothetical protein
LTPLSKKARVAGLLYILASAVGYLRLIYISDALIENGNAAATANNIAARRRSSAGELSATSSPAFSSSSSRSLYRLLEGVNRNLAADGDPGGFMVTPLFFVNAVTDVGTLQFARGADFLSVFDKPQRDAFTVLFLNLHHHLDLADAIFWGIWLIPFGLLVYRSRFLPRFLGVWLMLGCFGYLGFSFAGFLFPKYEDMAFTYGTPFRMGELATMFWLVIMGAKEQALVAVKDQGTHHT